MHKIILYIFFVIIIFYFVQDRFDIFDVSFEKEKGSIQEEKNPTDTEEVVEDTVEIFNIDNNSVIVKVDIADSQDERAQGLSGRSVLGDYEGMLFIMPNEGYHGFWMKDMLISLDFLFLDSKGFIVGMKENVPPCGSSVCNSFTSSVPFKYVIELNAGFIQKNGIDIGNSVVFNISSNL